MAVTMFLSNAEPERRTSTAIAPAANLMTSNSKNFPRATRALTRRYKKKAAKMGMGMEWIARKVLEDLEIVRKEYLPTGKGQPSDEFVLWFYDLEHYDRYSC